jgi:hypothetical protein
MVSLLPLRAAARRRVRGGPHCLEAFEAFQELVDAERLGEGVVGAGVQRGLRVRLGGPGQQQDRRGADLAQRADDVDHAGQAEIQEDQVGMLVASHLQCGGGGAGERDLVAADLQGKV